MCNYYCVKAAIDRVFPNYNLELKEIAIAGMIQKSNDEKKRKREEIQRASILFQSNRFLMSFIPDLRFNRFFGSFGDDENNSNDGNITVDHNNIKSGDQVGNLIEKKNKTCLDNVDNRTNMNGISTNILEPCKKDELSEDWKEKNKMEEKKRWE